VALQKRIAEFKQAIESQIELLDWVGERQSDVRTCLAQRNWPQLDGVIKELDELSRRVAHLEGQRVALQQEIGRYDAEPADPNRLHGGHSVVQTPGIKTVLRRCRAEERAELRETYRRLRVAVLRVQAGARGIRSYTSAAIETTRDVLNELFPADTEGQYARDGGKQHGTQRALILDHTL